MTRTWVTTVFLPLAGLVTVLAIGFGGEALYSAPMWKYYTYVEFNLQYHVLPATAALTTLLSTAVLLMLFWKVFLQTPRLQGMAVVYLAVGVMVNLYQPLRIWGLIFFGIYPLWPDWAWRILATNTLFTNSAWELAALGLIVLLLPKLRGQTG